jgi:hypothetical protein
MTQPAADEARAAAPQRKAAPEFLVEDDEAATASRVTRALTVDGDIASTARQGCRGSLHRVRRRDAHRRSARDPRSMGGCDHADCVVALCRLHHRAYDSGRLDLVSYLEPAHRWEAAHAVIHVGLARALRRLSNVERRTVKSDQRRRCGRRRRGPARFRLYPHTVGPSSARTSASAVFHLSVRGGRRCSCSRCRGAGL